MASLKNNRGITIVEAVLSAALVGGLILGVAKFLQNSREGLTMIETQGALNAGVQRALDVIRPNLAGAYRIFDNTPEGNQYLSIIDGLAIPAPLANSRLPDIKETGSLSPGAPNFVPSSVGNCLFFASGDKVVDAAGRRIDIFTFHYYYLTPIDKTIRSSKVRYLWEWHSVQYANGFELLGITDATEKTNVINALIAAKVTRAWNPGKPVDQAFYTLASGVMTQVPSSPFTYRIETNSAGNTINLLTGLTGANYRYSVSPNATDEYSAKYPVPRFAPTGGNPEFPSGFEVVVAGPASNREILIRLVVVAQVSAQRFIGIEGVSVTSARDVW